MMLTMEALSQPAHLSDTWIIMMMTTIDDDDDYIEDYGKVDDDYIEDYGSSLTTCPPFSHWDNNDDDNKIMMKTTKVH